MRRATIALALLLPATLAGAQTVSQWRTSNGLPLVVVQLPGGDVEHLAVVVPSDTPPTARLAGEPVQLTPLRLAQVLAVRASELQLASVTGELLAALRGSGAAVLVAMGPRPARELEPLLAAAEDVPWRPLPRERCPVVDGGVDAQSGSPERLELAFALPDPTDLRLALAPALGLWIERAVRAVVPGTRVDLDLTSGCARLVLRAPADGKGPRAVLRTLRSELTMLARRAPTPEELEALRAASAARLGRLAVDAAPVARELAQWVAMGGSPSTVLAASDVDPLALQALAGELLSSHSGWATVVESERRSRSSAPESLDNGALLSVTWIPGDMAVVALALGGFEPRAGGALLDRAATAAAGEGWATRRGELLGVPVVAVAVPGSAANDALELMIASLQAGEAPTELEVWGEVSQALGLTARPSAEAVSLAAALPLEAEEGLEAARKFLGGLGPGTVRVETPSVERRLHWLPTEASPALVAMVEIEGSPAGVAAVLVLQDRAAASGLEMRVLAPTGRLAVAVGGSGEAHLPALDTRLAAAWQRLVRPVELTELRAAQSRGLALALGDMAHALARVAAQPFLPSRIDEVSLRTVTAGDVTRVLGALPPWTGLARFARGMAPTQSKGVRQSPPGAPPGR